MTAIQLESFVAPVDLPLAQFPHSLATAPGMKTLAADHQPLRGAVRLNVPYANKSGMTLRLQVLLPPIQRDSTARFPCLVYVQGSAWFVQDLGAHVADLAAFAQRGFVVAIVEYRPSPLAPFPAQICDAKTAVRFLLDNAASFNVDPNRMAMWGDSSGGHTTVMTCLTQDSAVFDDEPEAGPLNLRCFVDYYGPTDIGSMNFEPSTQDHVAPDSPEGSLIGGKNVLGTLNWWLPRWL